MPSGRRRAATARRLFPLLLWLFPSMVASQSLSLELGRLSHPAFVAEGLRIAIGASRAAQFSIARLSVGEHRWEGLRVDCPDFRIDGGTLRCVGGTLIGPAPIERLRLDLRIEPARGTGRLALHFADGGRIDVVAREGAVGIQIARLSVARLARWFPELSKWGPDGRIEGRIDYSAGRPGARMRVAVRVDEGRFASSDGLQAAENLGLDLDVDARAQAAGWNWQARLAWTRGEAYLHPLYLTAGPAMSASGRFEPGRLSVTEAALDLEGVRTIAGSGEFDLSRGHLRRAALAVADADLAVVGPRFLAPLLAPASAEALRFAGHVSGGFVVEDERLVAVDLALDQAGFSMASNDLSFGPVSGRLPWRAASATEARLTVGGGRWQKLELGAFDIAARLDGDKVNVAPTTVPVLDGALVIESLALRRGERGWHGGGAARIEPLSMRRLTDAVGLPPMAGVLSASLPGLRVAPGEIALDGALVISLFDGYVQATRLQLLEPFGVAARLSADVEVRHLDLAQLTETFSFGRVTGFIDADVLGLELVRWRPVRFDARVRSSPGDYPRRISQRAVENIGALGGAGAAAAIQRSFLGFFETFGYREIGASCALRGGVCRLGGIEDDSGAPGGGYYLVRGGGIPAVNVIGYNRRVDWVELIDRLQRVIASNAAPVVR